MSVKVRIVSVQTRNSHFVGDIVELEYLLSKGFKIVACAAMGDYLLYTLVRE